MLQGKMEICWSIVMYLQSTERPHNTQEKINILQPFEIQFCSISRKAGQSYNHSTQYFLKRTALGWFHIKGSAL